MFFLKGMCTDPGLAKEITLVDKFTESFKSAGVAQFLLFVFLILVLCMPVVLPALIVLLLRDRKRYRAALKDMAEGGEKD